MTKPIRVVVLLSGGGTTLQNLIDRIADGRLSATIVHVLSDKAGAFGLERAARAGIPTSVVPRESIGCGVFDVCRAAGADLVCLAGFLRFLPIPPDFASRVMNIHPSLLPAFGGKGMFGHHVHDAVLAFGAKVSGCTVHFADNEFDHGPVIVQRAVPVLDGDTSAALAERVFAQECEAYPEAIQLFADGRLEVVDRIVRVRNDQSDA